METLQNAIPIIMLVITGALFIAAVTLPVIGLLLKKYQTPDKPEDKDN